MQLNDSWGAQFVILLTAKRLEKDLYCIILFSYKITNQSFIFTTSRETPNSTTSQPTII